MQSGKIKEGSANIPGEFIREGLTAVVSVKVPEPEFEGQTKTRLGNPEVRVIVDSVLCDALQTIFEWNPALIGAICNKAMAAQTAAIAAKAAREMVRLLSRISSVVICYILLSYILFIDTRCGANHCYKVQCFPVS